MSDAPQSGSEILVIDDDAIMRDLMSDWLEAAGYRVCKAGDCGAGEAALERGPALVVSDMWMPGPCGTSAIAWMKGKCPGVHVIAVSGHFGFGHGSSRDAALAAGAARTLDKPVKRAELLRAVAELIGAPPK